MNTYTYKKRRGRGTKRLGGDIHKHNVFKHIISVGYELETSSLSKLTLVYPKTGMDENPFLMNTDTARKDLDILQKKNGEDEEEEFDLSFTPKARSKLVPKIVPKNNGNWQDVGASFAPRSKLSLKKPLSTDVEASEVAELPISRFKSKEMLKCLMINCGAKFLKKFINAI
jgi:hypothetical protein